MDLSVKECIDGVLFLTEETQKLPSDTVKQELVSLELPKWYKKELYDRGRRFFLEFRHGFFISILMGVLVVFTVPSILNVLIGTKRTSTTYSAYKRYVSTTLHFLIWFDHELKPGSLSWKSLNEVRMRHIRAGLTGKLKGFGMVTQRGIALTQFGFMGYALLKPDKFGIRQVQPGDWEAYNHFWSVIGNMIGLEDRFNICRKTVHDTRQISQILFDRVFTPNMENVPEYFEHMSRVFLEGFKTVVPGVNIHSVLYACRYFTNVPGYVYTEADRIEFQERLRKKLQTNPLDTGVESSSLVPEPLEDGNRSNPRLLYYHDYETFETVPVYQQLSFSSKITLHINMFILNIYSVYVFRFIFNTIYSLTVYFMRYFPFGAFTTFGFWGSFVNPFEEAPVNFAVPKSNSQYYEEDKLKNSYSRWKFRWFRNC